MAAAGIGRARMHDSLLRNDVEIVGVGHWLCERISGLGLVRHVKSEHCRD